MLIPLYKIGGVLFRLLATNGFRVKAKKERFTAASSRCRQNLIFEVLTTTRARSRSFALCLYMKTIRAKRAKVQRDQHGILAKD